MSQINGVDPLDAIPAMREYECPDCGDHLTQQAIQQGPVPLSADGEDRGAGRYIVYTCPNHANYGMERGEDPDDKCYANVTVYASGFVSVDGDLDDRRDTLEQFLQQETDGELTVDDVHDSLRA